MTHSVKTVAVLFARADSIYREVPGCDVWDAERNALRWPGGAPVVAHPPCRSWGQLKHFAKPEPGEKELGPWAVDRARRWGGVVEHPVHSGLWAHVGASSRRDAFGGWLFVAPQYWWGHRADKQTGFYVVGCAPADIPPVPLQLGSAPCVVSPWAGFRKGMQGWRPQLRQPEREATPPALAEWLVELARRCATRG